MPEDMVDGGQQKGDTHQNRRQGIEIKKTVHQQRVNERWDISAVMVSFIVHQKHIEHNGLRHDQEQ